MTTTNNSLTQDEVDALFEHDQVDHIPSSEVKPYDFLSQERTVRAKLPAIQRIYERFVKKLDTSMYDLTSCEVEVSMKEIKTIKYSEYIENLPNPTCFNLVKMNPLRGTALFVLDAEFVFILVENFFGGDGSFNTIIENREFTPTELRVVQILLNLVFEDLQEAWMPVIPIKLELIKNEMNPQLVNIISGNDIVYVVPFKIGFSKGAGELNIVLPYAMLGTIREQLNMGTQRSEEEIDSNWVNALQNEICFANVELHSVLSEKQMTLRDVLNFKKDDVIPIDIPEQLTIFVENLATYKAEYGVSNDKCALKIIEKMKIK